MSVKLRFVRVGKKNRPAFRLCAIESRKARDGAYLENLGFYDPYIADDKKKIRINKERAEYWLGVGAQPSQTVLDFFKKEKVSGLIRQKPKRKRRKKKAQTAKPGAAPAVPGQAAAAKPGKKPKPPKKAKPAQE
jgi:small subunit ribosomal protein S16